MESLTTLSNLVGLDPIVIILIVAWTLAWKGFALWRAAELREKNWFIALFLLNTLGILDIIYLFVLTRGYKVEVVEEK